jgi:beta-galactosidase
MKKIIHLIFAITIFLIFGKNTIAQNNQQSLAREHLLMDFNWRFAFGNATDKTKDFGNGTSYFTYFAKAGFGDGAASANFEDRTWRLVNLPHDWAVELPFDSTASYSHGFKTVGFKYPETSVGWYRKTFTIPQSDLGKKISIQFDGIFRNSIVWVNGFYLGTELSGYAISDYDITDYLNYGGKNVVAVRVDASIEEGWFYEGAGIYRHVWLNKTSQLHVAQNGTFVTSDVNGNSAEITARVSVMNDSTRKSKFSILNSIYDEKGKFITSNIIDNLNLENGSETEYFSKLNIPQPKLWSPETPNLYKLKTDIMIGNKLVDEYFTTFGVRTLQFDANKGFFLNGKHYYIKGTNNHQDFAGVGTAVPDALQKYRIEKLKEMGCNAYRCSHNPPTPELLDYCDSLGMLVLDECRLMGSNQEHLNWLKRMMLRDRNHPSIFIWSLGNEEWAIEGNEKGARITTTMQNFAHRLDSSRSTTVANSGGWTHGTSTVEEVMGFNYIFNGNIDEQHKAFPDQPSLGTEETSTSATRGIYQDDSINAHMQPMDRKLGGRGLEDGWRFYAERPFLSGLFYWTGFDYRGEPQPYGWPQVCSQYGILDLCGFPKDSYYYLQSWWTDKPTLHLMPHWNWKGNEGKEISVWAYSNCDQVELFLNGKSLGKKDVKVNYHLEWLVKYTPGTLLAKGYKKGKEIITDKVETTGEPASIQLSADRTSISADGEDVSIITVQANDKKGLMVPTADNEIEFTLSGPGKIIGVGNGNPSSHEAEKYIERVDRIKIGNLKIKPVDSTWEYTETNTNMDVADWQNAFKSGYGSYEKNKNIVVIGTFNINDFTDKTEITFYSKSLAENQAVYLNGHLLGKNIKRDDPNQVFVIDHKILNKGENVIAFAGKPFVKKYKYDEISTDPGMVKVVDPPAKWNRKLFNGYAQVIIQSEKNAGEFSLSAISKGLIKSEIKIKTNPVKLRASAD